ncbi:MAG: ABC transporter permease [Nocardioidaceae bacterium]
MWRATFKSLLARKLRLAMSGFAIVIGVAFVAGSFVFTDTLGHSFDNIVKGSTGDVVVQLKNAPDSGSQDNAPDTRTIPASLVGRLRSVPGVARVDGNVSVGNVFVVSTTGKLIGGQGAPSFGFNYNTAPAITGDQALQIVKGQVPRGTGQMALDQTTADRAGYHLGDTVRLVTIGAQPRLSAELVGIAQFGGGATLGATLAVFDTKAAQDLFYGGRDVFSNIWVTTKPGVSQTQLVNEIRPLLPPDVEAVTGDSAVKKQQNSIGTVIGYINTFLLVFAAIALVVGSFLIINTFSILVAQRSRELALLRALGATRRQVTRSVLVESAIVGFAGSTAGLLLGFVLAIGLKALFAVFGLDLSGASLIFAPRTAIVAYVVGMVVTVFAAYLPARRASKIAPVAAMSDDIAMPESSLHRRSVVGSVLVVLGIVAMVVGFGGSGGGALLAVGLGVLAILVGVALLSPIIGRPVLQVLGVLYRRVFGTTGALAAQNAVRNPRRTAATASALMIGLTLMSAMSVFASSTNASIDKEIAKDLTADYIVSNVISSPFSPTVAKQIATVPGVGQVAAVRGTEAKVNGHKQFSEATDITSFTHMFAFTTSSGSLSGLHGSTIALETKEAKSLKVRVGDTVSMAFPVTTERLKVVATYDNIPGVATYLVPFSVFDAAKLQPADMSVYVTRAPGASAAAVTAGINGVIKDLPTVTLKDQKQFADQQKAGVNQVLYLIYALLGLAIVIAILGIVNTLALSVIERTREVGLLRAVGMSRRQLRRMVRLESVAIAVLGAVLGVVMGVAFGVALQQTLASQGIAVLSIPVAQLIVFVVLAAIVGVLAAWFPSRRAARLDVLRAITTE